jgi:hypothetical protein
MQIIHEEIEGVHYMDIILFPEDIEKMQDSEMVSTFYRCSYQPYYIGARLHKGRNYEKVIDWEEED